ncbi:hypothetical protein [Salibacterium lacus]|uniref:Phage tail protein n=1 Tax=Salibacterium lacus TaxID=1898109 RepID=A0ABW5SXA2_9BACI
MTEITLGGEKRQLRFSHIAMKSMEEHYNMGLARVFKEVDMESIDNMAVMIWACLRRFDKSVSMDDVEIWLDDSIENGETSYEEIGEKIQEVFQNSMLVKQATPESEDKSKNKTGA